MNAVASDCDLAARGRTIGEIHGDAAIVLLERDAMLAGDELVGTNARTEGVGEDHLQFTAVDGELRILVSSGAAERFLVDDATLARSRIALLAATRQVLANALALLGVEAPQSMTREGMEDAA